jgi:autotransporter-associated beta strand protein
VTKTGAGTLEVTAANSYTNGTIVNVGKLLVNNTSGSGTGTNTVTVAAGAFLGGTGTIAGATTVNGTLEPGSNAVGTLNASSTVSLAVGSTYAVEITGAGTNDKVAATGALTANGTIAVTLDGYVPVLGNTFDIADASGFSGTPTFNFAAAPLTLGLVWDTSQFLTTGTISVVSADPYNAWAADNGIVEGKFGDDDDDGVANLIEFATNSDAADGSSGARVYPKMHLLGGDNVLTYTVAVRKNATFAAGVPDASKQQATKDQILYTIEASNDLTTWNAVTVTKLNPGDSTAVQAAITPALPVLDADWEWHTFRTDGGASVDVSDYIRLNVLVAP